MDALPGAFIIIIPTLCDTAAIPNFPQYAQERKIKAY